MLFQSITLSQVKLHAEVFIVAQDGAFSCREIIVVAEVMVLFPVPWKKVVSEKLHIFLRVHFHTFRDPGMASQLSPDDSCPKEDSVADIAALLEHDANSPTIHCSIHLDH